MGPLESNLTFIFIIGRNTKFKKKTKHFCECIYNTGTCNLLFYTLLRQRQHIIYYAGMD